MPRPRATKTATHEMATAAPTIIRTTPSGRVQAGSAPPISGSNRRTLSATQPHRSTKPLAYSAALTAISNVFMESQAAAAGLAP